MNLKTSFTIAVACSIIGLAAWELYWRSQDFVPSINDDKALWAVQRARVNKSNNDKVVLFGSSRVLFDIQLDEWEAVTGKRPIQLATAGASPIPQFKDLVDNTDFTGTVIVGVTPGLFFSTTFPQADPWKRAQSRVDYYNDRTLAQRIDHKLSLPMQQTFVFPSAGEEELDDDIDLKSLLRQIKIGNRNNDNFPPFYEFGKISKDRNMAMIDRTVQDTAFANTVIRVWIAILTGELPPPDKESTTAAFVESAKKFKEKGGNLILLRCPSSGGFKDGETQFLPRATFWDELVEKSGAIGYHYEDYEQFQNFICPEWSHLSAADARFFTTELATIMMNDKVLSNPKAY
jgi:hypothetical protein